MLLLVICILAILSNIETILFENGSFYDNSQTGARKLTKRGRALVFVMIILLLTLLQNNIQERIDKKKQAEIESDQRRRDSIQRASYDSSVNVIQKNYTHSINEMKEKFDTSNNRTTYIISETLGKYGFKLDSANQTLVKGINNSFSKKTDKPVLTAYNWDASRGISLLKLVKNEFQYQFVLYSKFAASTQFDLKASIVVLDTTTGYFHAHTIKCLSINSIVAKNSYATESFKVSRNLTYRYLYLWIRGTYQPLSGDTTLYMDKVIFHDKFTITHEPIDNIIMKKIKATVTQHEKYKDSSF